ncbi:P-loop containing nucleoside triphosphate hydrolase protein [Neocallimastix californiae]|uniref:p-loop containing nucleoside triphosphate hydrolase protein n=1 Tax=Neocallimastix californiae TaxID=1754190 RepID=A0A1Y2F1S1_9FUNG|nr:P-loop containing nucleoside triphosphate hydrolase protein [Neocallimastix californiae]|eukprot:ORY77838.1 P-loop containing nucleoside triphosphate hydrolase protein [Neocallimastix californiae]
MNFKNIFKKKEKNISSNVNEEMVKNVSFFKLFKYASIKEKIMICIAVLAAVLQGSTLPTIFYFLGDILNVLTSLVVNITLKNITGIKDENTLGEFMDIINSGPNPNFTDFSRDHKDINPQMVMEKYRDSYYNDYDLSSSKENFKFRTMDEIFHDLYIVFIICICLALFCFCCTFISNSFLNITSSRQSVRIRNLAFNSIMKQEIAWHEKTNPGELSSRIISDSLLIEDGIGFKLAYLICNLSIFVAGFIVAFISGWRLTLNIAIIIPIIAIVAGGMSLALKHYTKKSQKSYAEVGGIAQEAFTQIRTIVSFGNEQKEIDRYVDKLKTTKKIGLKKAQAMGIGMGIMNGLTYVAYGYVFLRASQFIYKDIMNGGECLKTLMGILFGARSISQCSVSFNAIGDALGAASKLFHIIERKPKLDREKGETPKEPIQGFIEFKEVHFTYPARPEVEVLKGVSFSCSPGQTIAIVGASGSGKSTIVQLLERYYERKEGDIYIDHRRIEDYNVHWLRTQIGLVSQEPTLFDTTIAENIAMACPQATQQEIEAAAKLANAHDFILKLPKGYQTKTGERGLQLSGGQKQRICIARALMTNPKILLLDEATSALDNRSEKVVQSALDLASSGRTTIVIAHRLSTVKNADCIIVMDQGTIIESGTHEELMAKENVYYNLVKNQDLSIDDNGNGNSHGDLGNRNSLTFEQNQENELDPDEIIIQPVEDEEDDDDDDEEEEEEEKEQNKKNTEEQKDSNEDSIDSHSSLDLQDSTQKLNRKESQTKINKKKLKGKKNKKNKKDKSKPKERSALATIDWKRLIQYNKPLWFLNLIGLIGSFVNGVIQPLFAYIFGSAMDVLNEQGEQLLDDGRHWFYWFSLLGLLNLVSVYLNNCGFYSVGEFLSYTFRSQMYNSMMRQEVGFFDTNEIATEAGLVHNLNVSIGAIIEVLITTIAGFTIAFVNGWKMTLILLITVPLVFAATFIFLRYYDVNAEKRSAHEGTTKVAVEAITNIKTIYALNLEDRFCQQYYEKLMKPQSRIERKHIISAIASGYSEGILHIVIIFCIYLGTIFIRNEEMKYLNVWRVLFAIIFTATGAGRVSSAIPDLSKGAEAFSKVVEIIDRTPKINTDDPSGYKEEPFRGAISLRDIKFQYPSRPNITVLCLGKGDVIEIPEGQMLALVGASGSGKSTILGLLPRWYDITEGEILIDDRKHIDYNIRWLRRHMGMVNQEPDLFNISIRDNILYGKEDATEEEIIEAAKKANIHDFIMSLPEGYDTLVGNAGTTQMSGGQKQRIAIARAMIRNPKILLLDEACSALDAESELIVQKALEEASHGRTTITVAHRLSSVRNADKIVVMKEGHVAEMGTHEELMAKKGEYYEMVLAGGRDINDTNNEKEVNEN